MLSVVEVSVEKNLFPQFVAKHNKILLAILILSVLLRLGVALYLGDSTPPGKDETSYSILAARLAGGHGYSFPTTWYPGFALADTPTAHWSFLYTAFVAAIYALFGIHPLAVRLLQALLTGLLLPWTTYRLAQRMLLSPEKLAIRNPKSEIRNPQSQIPLLSAFLAAIYAYFILFDAMVQTEAFFIIAVLWSLERSLALQQLYRRPAGRPSPSPPLVRANGWSPLLPFTLGLSLGLATLLRQSILPWIVILFLYLLWFAHRNGKLRPAFISLFIAGIILLAFILPFTVRNYIVYGDFLLLNSNAGYAMYSAQHPLHGTSFQAYAAAPLPTDLNPMPQNEAQWDRALMKRGIQFVLADPVRYLRLSLSRVADYFEFWPKADSSLLFNLGRLLSFTLFLPFMLYGLWLSFRNPHSPIRSSQFAILYLFLGFYSLLHILTWAMPRYRLPVDAVLLIFAALALTHLWQRFPYKHPLNN